MQGEEVVLKHDEEHADVLIHHIHSEGDLHGHLDDGVATVCSACGDIEVSHSGSIHLLIYIVAPELVDTLGSEEGITIGSGSHRE